MSINTTEYCDVCEYIDGKGIEKAIIKKPPGRPAFPQLIWTYYKKGLQIFKKQDGSEEPVIQENWLGKPNRLEFCDEHGKDFNILLKYFCQRDYDICKILDKLKAEDDEEWAEKQDEKTKEFIALHKKWSNRKKVVRI